MSAASLNWFSLLLLLFASYVLLEVFGALRLWVPMACVAVAVPVVTIRYGWLAAILFFVLHTAVFATYVGLLVSYKASTVLATAYNATRFVVNAAHRLVQVAEKIQ